MQGSKLGLLACEAILSVSHLSGNLLHSRFMFVRVAAVFSSWALDEAVEQAAETPRNEAEKRRIAVLTVRGIRLSVSAQIAFSCFEFRIARVCGLGHCG
jgi:hypothetical protein